MIEILAFLAVAAGTSGETIPSFPVATTAEPGHIPDGSANLLPNDGSGQSPVPEPLVLAPAPQEQRKLENETLAPVARLVLARKLIDLFHPEEEMVASNIKAWRLMVRNTAAKAPLMKKIEEKYPGAAEAYIVGATPAALKHARVFVQRAKRVKTDAFARHLTDSELRELIAFFEGPLGKRLIELQSSTAATTFIKSALRNTAEGHAKMSMKDVRKMQSRSADHSIQRMSADELLGILHFTVTPVASKFHAAVQASDVELLKLVNNRDPSSAEAEAKAGLEAVEAFVQLQKH